MNKEEIYYKKYLLKKDKIYLRKCLKHRLSNLYLVGGESAVRNAVNNPHDILNEYLEGGAALFAAMPMAGMMTRLAVQKIDDYMIKVPDDITKQKTLQLQAMSNVTTDSITELEDLLDKIINEASPTQLEVSNSLWEEASRYVDSENRLFNTIIDPYGSKWGTLPELFGTREDDRNRFGKYAPMGMETRIAKQPPRESSVVQRTQRKPSVASSVASSVEDDDDDYGDDEFEADGLDGQEADGVFPSELGAAHPANPRKGSGSGRKARKNPATRWPQPQAQMSADMPADMPTPARTATQEQAQRTGWG